MIQRQTSRVYGHSGHPKPIVLSAKVCRLHWFFIMVTGMCFCNVTFISKGMSRWFPSDWYCSCRIIEDTSLITILQSYYKGTNYSFLTISWQRFTQFYPNFVVVLSLGRAGRVSTGICYRMVTREFYQSCLPQFGIPEMQVNSAHCIILAVTI